MTPLERTRRAATKRRTAADEFRNAIMAARQAGHTVREIADAAGVTHPRIIQILKAPSMPEEA